MSRLDLRRAIKEHGLTITGAARNAGMSPQSMQQFINGNPTVDKLYILAEAIGCDVVELFYPTESELAVQEPEEEIQVEPSVYFCPQCGTKFQILESMPADKNKLQRPGGYVSTVSPKSSRGYASPEPRLPLRPLRGSPGGRAARGGAGPQAVTTPTETGARRAGGETTRHRTGEPFRHRDLQKHTPLLPFPSHGGGADSD